MENTIYKPKSKPVTKGPVANLEQHLQADWWKQIFNATYLKTDADVVEDPSITEGEVNLFSHLLNIQKGDTVLDLACGQGRHLIELAKRGNYQLFGLDRSRYLIQRARSRAKKNNLSIQFKEGDVRRLPYPNDFFDCVTILGNSFGYFEAATDDLKVLKEVFRVLKPEGTILMDVADGSFLKEQFTSRSWEWIDQEHFVCRERSLATDQERLISREIVTHTEKGIIVDQFYAERLYTKEQLLEMLRQVGFTNLAFHGALASNSQRNQDLGMMEKRFILTGVVLKEWTPKKGKKATKQVAVVMGDPKRKDIIKPNATFDYDDFETIDKLKMALSQLDDYKFTYLDDHTNLIAKLQKLTGKIDFVLNLCDEGFDNDAVKELHIPALLEMLQLPYTGSNPQTLAYCYDKSLIRGIATEIGVPVADAFIISAEDNLIDLNLPFPVIAKPNYGDSSFGITKKNVAYSVEDLSDAIVSIRRLFGYQHPILVEEFLTGAEISIGIIGNPEAYQVLPIIEEDYSDLPKDLPKICGYEAKWLPDSPYMKHLRSIPADLSIDTTQAITRHSMKLFERLNCRDYCRFDWRLNAAGEPRLLEVNPNPGWCWDGHLAKMCAIGNLNYSEMLAAILEATQLRYRTELDKK